MSSPEPLIRPALPADASAISRVHQASREAIYRGHVPDELLDALSEEERLARWTDWLEDPAVLTLVTEVEGRIVGLCTLRAAEEPDLDDGCVAEMPTLYLHPSVWRRGLGAALCRAIEERAAEMGYEVLILWVMEMNQRARAFYVALGFHEDGAEKIETPPEPIALKALRYRKSLA